MFPIAKFPSKRTEPDSDAGLYALLTQPNLDGVFDGFLALVKWLFVSGTPSSSM